MKWTCHFDSFSATSMPRVTPQKSLMIFLRSDGKSRASSSGDHVSSQSLAFLTRGIFLIPRKKFFYIFIFIFVGPPWLLKVPQVRKSEKFLGPALKKRTFMVYKRRSTKSKSRKAAMTPKRKRVRYAPKPTVALIKSVIAREQETKYRSETTGNQLSNSQIGSADIIRLLPKLLQDQGEGRAYERVGTKITPKKLRADCHVSFAPDLNRSMAIEVHYFVLTSKSQKNINSVLGLFLQDLLRTGDQNLFFHFDGNVDVAMLPVNNTEYNVIKRGKFKLSKNTGLLQDSVVAGNQPLGGPVSKSFSFTIPTPAKFVYEQDNQSPRQINYPNNFAPFIVFGYTHQDTSVPDYLNTDIKVVVRPELWYDDA